jgi:hypothetical protein
LPQAPRIDSLTKTFLLSVLLFLATQPTSVFAQWVQTIDHGEVRSLAVNGNGTVFIGNWGQGVYSPHASIGMLSGNSNSREVSSLAVSGTTVYAGTMGGVYVSTNNGESWTKATECGPVLSLAVSGSAAYAGTYGGVYVSTNNGTTWTAANNGITHPYVYSLAVSGSTVFAGANDGAVYISTNNGTSWTAANNGLPNGLATNGRDGATVLSLTMSGSTVFAGTAGFGVYVSTNNGASWAADNNGFTTCKSLEVTSLAVSGSKVLAGTGDGVFATK